jgi:dihydrofolate synthase/folylpolyglutamate synthase
MTYDDAIAFWYGRINYEVRAATPHDLKLERMRALLPHLGNPHERVRTIHVTGTKGKGSTAAMIAASLQAAGYRVGLFTSPHLTCVEERIQVNGVPISRDELTAEVERLAEVMPLLERGPWTPPTFFEMSTAIGYSHFLHRRVEFAVVEVGLGGRFDSTNICEPVVSVITSVGLDHTAQLGNTLEEIAHQKAGIIKRGVPVVCGVTQPGPRAVIEREAAKMGVRVVQLGRDFEYDYRVDGPDGRPVASIATPRVTYPKLSLRLLGEHQASNAAIALTVLDELVRVGVPISEPAVRRGLAEVRWPARIEVVRTAPLVVLDTAHNVPSVQALVATLGSITRGVGKKAVVFGVSNDKQYEEMVRILAGYFDVFHLTKYGNNPRSVPPEELAAVLKRIVPTSVYRIHPTASEAWEVARSEVTERDLICVTGSVFLAGELKSIVSSG